MDFGLIDKVAMVTGAASQVGMGHEICLVLAKEGCDIISCDIDLVGAQKTADAVTAMGRRADAFKVDVTKAADCDEAVKAVQAQFGRIDILVNTAGGIVMGGGSFLDQKQETWEKDIDLNLYGTMNMSKSVLRGMVARKYGKIINFASIAAKIGPLGSYSAAKAAVLSITRGLASTYGPDNINVNAIAPGVVATNFQAQVPEERKKMMFDGMAQRVPMRRIQTTSDVANAVAFLASDVSMNITGQCLQVDGGMVML